MTLSSNQFGSLDQYQLRYRPLPDTDAGALRHQIMAVDRNTNTPAGFMLWGGPEVKGRISNINVNYEHGRRGIGSALYKKANELAQSSGGRIQPPSHSDNRTAKGDAWAKKVGGDLPENRKEYYDSQP
jgi:ribosomal protein S18 acetylase RimI-like enzyme